MATYKLGDRVLVHDVDERGRILKRSWYVGTVEAIGRRHNRGTYRVRFDNGGAERIDQSEIYGRTPLKRKRTTAIKGAEELRKWRPEVRKRQVRTGKGQGLTAKQMIGVTPAFIKRNAEFVSLRRKEIRRRGDRHWTWMTQTLTAPAGPSDKARKHKQQIDILTPGVKDAAKSGARLKVSCDCGNFQFMWEAALHKRKAADIKYSNGEDPVVTNPRMVPGVCKHLFLVLGGR